MKKSFKDNPALQFLSTPSAEPKTEPIEEEAVDLGDIPDFADPVDAPAVEIPKIIPEGYKVNPMFIEKKSKRAQLLLQPSVHAKASKLAKRNGISLNEFIHKAIEEKIAREE